MANPTTYFGWVMPNSADLVTDLPADFAVFGQGVDTSMSELLGGTTGQVLAKTSATNMDFTWTTPGGAAGISLINTTTFSSSTSTSVNNVFSTTYDNYKILVVAKAAGGTGAETTMRLRVGGTDSTVSYTGQEIYSSTTSLASRANLFGTDEWYLTDFGNSSQPGILNIEIASPFITAGTSFTGLNAMSGGPTLKITGGAQTDATSFTGFTMIFALACTGTISTYGYAK